MSKLPPRKKAKPSSKSFRRDLRRTLKYAKSSKKYVIIYAIINVVTIPLSVVAPMLSAQLILDLTGNKLEQLLYTALVVLAIDLVRQILAYFDVIVYRKIYLQMMVELRMAVIREALKLEVYEIDKSSAGLFISRLNMDVGEMGAVLGEYIYQILGIITRIGVMGAIFIMNKYMFAYALVTALATYAIKRRGLKREYEIHRQVKSLEDEVTGLTGELIRGARDVKTLNAGAIVLSRMSDRIQRANDDKYKALGIRNRHWLFSNATEAFFGCTFFVLAVILMKYNLVTIPVLIVIYKYRTHIVNLMTNFTEIAEYNERFTMAAERVYEVIDNKVFDKEKFGDIGLDHLEGKIEFDQVSFSYDHDDHKRPILDRISFTVRPNERVAFVGRSGAGKTTIFSLITRLYHADSGTIKLDGYDIESLTRDSIRNNMSIITQSPYIFNFSIKDNLLIAKPGASMREIRSVCQAACIDDYIMSLPEGYETMLGEGGVILSGGQRQRLAIARALLKKTEVILFDEATSALDNETQEQIQRAIGNLQGEYTILIVAHRLSTVIDSDRIFVVDKGKIVADGTHQELLRSCQFYHDLYRKDLV